MNNVFSHTSLRPPLWTFILFLIYPFLAFPEIIFGGQTLYRTDITWIHYPGHIFMAEEWLAGRVPLWDPYRQAGVPMLAEPQIGVLYPLRILFLSPLSPSLELSLFILLHFTLAALFTYILARSLRLSQASATLAGLIFGFGGFLMAQVSNVNILSGAIWLPLTLFATMQVARRRIWPGRMGQVQDGLPGLSFGSPDNHFPLTRYHWLAALLAGIPLALQIYTAHSQIVFYTLVVISAYGLYRLCADFYGGSGQIRRNLQYALHTTLLVAATIASGLLWAAPQLLPTFELLQFTLRSQGRGPDLLTENSLHPLMWFNLIIPSAFGNNAIGFKGGDPFQEIFIYVGFIPLILAVVGLTGRRGADRLFFQLLLIGAVLLALGGNTPLYEYVIQYLPGFDLFRIPARWLMVASLALAVLAGFGLDQLIEQGLSRRAVILFLGIGLLLAGCFSLIWIFRAGLLSWSQSLNEFYGRLVMALLDKGFTPAPVYRDRLLLRWAFGLNTPVFLWGVNFIVAAVLFVLLAGGRLAGRVFSGLVILAVSLDLLLAGGTAINPVKPEERWQQLSGGARFVLDHLEGARVLPLGVSGEEEAVRYLGQYFPSAYRVLSASGYSSPLKLARYETFLDKADPVQALQVLGVRYLLTRGQMGADVAATYPLAFSEADSYVYENKNPLPRVFMVRQAIQASGPTDALAYFETREIDPAQVVILESETAIPSPAPAGAAASRATIINQNPQWVEVETRTAADSYLVLLDTYYPGWMATIDGQPTPIYRADYLVRAVFVPAGEHRVRFEYRPRSFQVGLGLALGMIVVLIILAFFSFRRSNCSGHSERGTSEESP